LRRTARLWATLDPLTLLASFLEEVYQIVSMLFFHSQNTFHHASRGWIVVTEVLDYLAITINGDPFSNQILLDHVDQSVTLDEFGMTARQQPFGIEIWRTPQLNYSLGNLIGVTLLFVGVLQKLSRDTFGVDPGSHEIVTLVPQHANDFRRQRFIQHLDHGLSVGLIAFGYRALVDVLACSFAERFDVSQKWFISHDVTP
jgi:hypothetical protein